jgi:hypothetical protein
MIAFDIAVMKDAPAAAHRNDRICCKSHVASSGERPSDILRTEAISRQRESSGPGAGRCDRPSANSVIPASRIATIPEVQAVQVVRAGPWECPSGSGIMIIKELTVFAAR